MPKNKLTHESSIDELEAWINDNSKKSDTKKIKKLNEKITNEKKMKAEEERETSKYKKHIIDKQFSRKNDPLYGKKGHERKQIINDYKKQYEQAKLAKKQNNISPDMIQNLMNTIKEKGHNPEEIMQKINSPDYSEEYKNELIQSILA